MQNKLSFGVWVILFIVAVVMIGLVGLWPFGPVIAVTVRWLLILAVVIAFVALLGKQIHRRYDGILIDARFKISLSRFQLVLWTIMILSAFLAMGLERNRLLLSGEIELETTAVADRDAFGPLNITFPPELLVALGISTASLAGAGLITNSKKETISSRKIELLNDERERFAQEQKEALIALGKAADQIQEYAARERQLAQDRQNDNQRLSQLKEDLTEQETTYQRLRQAALNAPEDALAQEAMATSEEAVQRLRLQIAEITAQAARREAFITAAQKALSEAIQEREVAQIALSRATQELERIEEATRNRVGVIYMKESPEQADWLDLFRGDEINNHQIIDLAKVQMFFFTIAIVFTYAVLIWALMAETALMSQPTVSFPPFSETLAALLGLSHAGYLVVKGTG